MSGRTRANIRKRGETYTYYAYVTEADGRRRQVSKGGFRTRREAEAARVETLNTIQTGTFVRPGADHSGEFFDRGVAAEPPSSEP